MEPPQLETTLDDVARRVRRLLDEAGAALTGRRVLALCSGGADSVALVHLLAALPRGAAPRELHVLWLDHGLRLQVAPERAAAAAAAAAVGAAFHERSVEPGEPSLDARGGGLEAAARAWRYSMALDVARATASDIVVTGHTADDQLECALLSLVGVTGAPGVPSAMTVERPLADGVALVRPLLATSREEVERVCQSVGAAWADDPTNADPEAHVRNAVRARVVPALLELHPGAGRALVRGADRAGEARAVVDGLARTLLATWATDGSLDIRQLAPLDPPVRRALLGRWLLDARLGRDIGTRTIAAVDRLVTMPGRAACARVDLPRGACVRRDGYDLTLTPPRHGRPHP